MGHMISVSEIAEQINAQAASLAPELLPNGRRAGNKWMFSGVADSGLSESAWLDLSGSRIGHWRDAGNCGAGEDKGDLLDLLRLRLGLDAKGAVEEAKRRLGIHDEWSPGEARRPDPAEMARRAEDARARHEARCVQEAREKEVKARRARSLWLAGAPIAGSPAEAYLLGRALDRGPAGEWPRSLHYHGEVWHKGERCKLPALLAAIYRADGTQIGTHRIFLQRERAGSWVKIASAEAKMVLGNMWGGFVPINRGSSHRPMSALPEGEAVYVTEGIEDAVCVRMMKPEARIVAAISLGNVGAIVLPEAARKLVIVADRDDKPKAQEALERSIAQQQARGLEVRLVMPPAEVNGIGVKDVNDWWRAILAAQPGMASRQGRAA